MDETVLHHLASRIGSAAVNSDPYPYFFVDNVFPDDFYQDLISSFPDTSYYTTLSQMGKASAGTYEERFILPLEEESLTKLPFSYYLFWQKFALALSSDLWISMLKEKFDASIRQRFAEKYDSVNFSSVAELMCDRTNYSIGPHTDHPIRVLTLLFYFPRNEEQRHLGTSVYKPTDPSFTCEGFKHHSFENFTKLYTAPFVPNSVFGFFKSENSFHGVEPIQEPNIERHLMNYILQWTPKYRSNS